VIYIGGGCRTLPPLLFAPTSSAPGILPVLQDVPVNHREISSDSSGTAASMPLAAGNLRKSGEYRVKRTRIFFEAFLLFPGRVPRYYLVLNVDRKQCLIRTPKDRALSPSHFPVIYLKERESKSAKFGTYTFLIVDTRNVINAARILMRVLLMKLQDIIE